MIRSGRFIPRFAGFVGLLALACSQTDFDRQFEAGRYVEAARAFDADSTLGGEERALYRAGVTYALPGAEIYDPSRARALLQRLLQLYPETGYRQGATWVLEFLDQAEDQRREIQRLESELEQLKAIDLGRRPNEDP